MSSVLDILVELSIFMNPVFLVCRFCFEDCLLSIPVFISMLASEMSALDPAQNAFFIGIGFDGKIGLLAIPGPPLVFGLEFAAGGKLVFGYSFIGELSLFFVGYLTPFSTSLTIMR